MFFIASKILHFLLVPLYWIFGMLITSFFVNARKKRILTITSLILLYLYTTDFALNFLYKQWEYPSVWYKDIPKEYDAAIVLGGIAAPGKKPDDRTHIPGSPDRLMHAMHLYKLGKVKKIIISGGSGEILGDQIPEAQYLRNVLLLCEVDKADILIENQSRNTHENALFSKELITRTFKNENPKFLIITSAWHMKRSIGCFNKVGINVRAFPVDSQVAENISILNSLIPFPWNPSRWQTIIHEYCGYVIYKIYGYL